MTKPIPRRNFHRGAGRTAGGSERRPSDEGRAAGGGDAATTPQAAHQLKELLKTSRMDAATPRNPSNDQRACRAPPRQSQACSRTSPTTASPARATPGRSSSRGTTPRERRCLRVTGAGMDAGGFAQPAGRRPAMTKPNPRRNFPRRAGRTAGGSERRRTDEGRAAGGGDAATRPQATHQPQELHKTSRMDAARPTTPRTTNTRCAPPRQSQACSRTSPTTASPARDPPARQAPAAGRRGSVGVPRVTGAGMDAGGFAQPAGRRPAITKPIPRRNFQRRAGRTAGGSEQRRTHEGRAAGGGDAGNKTSSRTKPKNFTRPAAWMHGADPQPPRTTNTRSTASTDNPAACSRTSPTKASSARPRRSSASSKLPVRRCAAERRRFRA